jgi:hypothetical protein
MQSVSIKNTNHFTQYKEVIAFRYDDKHMKHINAYCSNTPSYFVLRTDSTGNLAFTVKFHRCTVQLDITKVLHSQTDALFINLRKL